MLERKWPDEEVEFAEDRTGVLRDVAKALGRGGGQKPHQAGSRRRKIRLGLMEDGDAREVEKPTRAPSLVRATRKYLQTHPGALEEIAKAMVYKAQEGDPAVLKMLFDRLDGAVVQKQLTADVVVKRLNVGQEEIREIDAGASVQELRPAAGDELDTGDPG